MQSLSRKDIRNTLILITSVLIIAIIVNVGIWLSGNTLSQKSITTVFIAGPIIITLSWISYFYQKKIDKNQLEQSANISQKVFQTINKASGVRNKISSIIGFIVSPIMIMGGILTLLSVGERFTVPEEYKLILSIPIIIIGVTIFIIAIYLWKRGSLEISGRMYKQETSREL